MLVGMPVEQTMSWISTLGWRRLLVLSTVSVGYTYYFFPGDSDANTDEVFLGLVDRA